MDKKYRTTEKCYAKINLTLDVLNKRGDGYHNVLMIMQTVSLYDKIVIKRYERLKGVSLCSNLRYLPCDERNNAYKAVVLFLELSGIKNEGIKIELYKKIPVGAGLAGGSTDAAGVLRGLNRLFNTGYTPNELAQMGVKIGADVPYCITGGTALCEGIGEIVTPLNPLSSYKVVLCKPKYGVSTAKIYSALKADEIKRRPDTAGALDAIASDNPSALWGKMYNVLEDITSAESQDVPYIKDLMLKYKAEGALMSGSGPTVFGVFESEGNAKAAFGELSRKYSSTFISEMVNPNYFE